MARNKPIQNCKGRIFTVEEIQIGDHFSFLNSNAIEQHAIQINQTNSITFEKTSLKKGLPKKYCTEKLLEDTNEIWLYNYHHDACLPADMVVNNANYLYENRENRSKMKKYVKFFGASRQFAEDCKIHCFETSVIDIEKEISDEDRAVLKKIVPKITLQKVTDILELQEGDHICVLRSLGPNIPYFHHGIVIQNKSENNCIKVSHLTGDSPKTAFAKETSLEIFIGESKKKPIVSIKL